jgi:divalent metal cation (Fe/Co/Zn/Cd) transporter
VAVLLFTVVAVFSIYQGVNKIASPGRLEAPAVAYVVLGISMILEALSLRTGIKEANEERRPGHGWRQFVHVTKTPELPVVLLEDTAALLGLLFAFLGVLLSQVTGHEQWDGVGSVAVGILLAGAAFVVGYEMKSLLIGESATEESTAQIVAALEGGPEQFRLIHLRTSHIGPDTLLVAAKIGVHGDTTARELAAGIDAAEKRVRAAVPIAETIYLEPDIYRPDMEDLEDPSVRVVQENTTRRRRRFRGQRRT